MIITSGKLKGKKVLLPDEKITRPTLSKVRMAIFNTLQSIIDFEGKSFLDMFAGSGIIGIEAFSRGFSEIIAIENSKPAFNILKINHSKLKTDAKLIFADAIKVMPKITDKTDVIYIDPPYFSGIYESCLKVIKNCEIIIIEHFEEINICGFEVIKQKKYGNKFLTFLKY